MNKSIEPLSLEQMRAMAAQMIEVYIDTCMPPGMPEPDPSKLPPGETFPYGALANGRANAAFIVASIAMIAIASLDGKDQTLKRIDAMRRAIERLTILKP